MWEERIMLFVAFLIEENKQSTIKSYLSAIRAVLRQDRINLQEDQFLLTSLTRAACLRNDKVKLHLPIQKGMLGLLIDHVKNYFEVERNQIFLSVLYQTLLSTGYFGLFRIGELISGSHPVRASDIHVGTNKNKFMFYGLLRWTGVIQNRKQWR